MTNEQFENLMDAAIAQERATLINKAGEYASDADRFHNFYAGAAISGQTPARTLWGFLVKHLVSVRDIVDGRKADRAMLREKIGDCRNYLVLLEGLLLDEAAK
jgi:hypothetical protein